MKLVQLVHGYPPAVGGVEYLVRDVCEGLVRRHGFEVEVLTTDAVNNANFRDARLPTIPIVPGGEVVNGVRVRRFPVSTRWAGSLRVGQALAWRLRLPGNDRLRTLFHGPISPALEAAAQAAKADVVAAASFPLNHLAYAFREAGPPVALLGAVHPDDRWGYERPRLLELARRAEAVIALSGPEEEWFHGRGVPAGRIHVLPVGIDPEPVTGRTGAFRASAGIPAEGFVIAFVGQLGSHKGIGTLLKAFPQVLASVPEARLVVAGSPTPWSTALPGLVAGLPAPARDRVVLAGRLDAQRKGDLLAGCDLFASPSAGESFGITTLEAWANARPAILGDSPATRWVTDSGRLAILVPPGDAAALARAVIDLAASAGRRLELGDAGRRRLLDRHTLEAMVDGHAELYERLATRAAPAAPADA